MRTAAVGFRLLINKTIAAVFVQHWLLFIFVPFENILGKVFVDGNFCINFKLNQYPMQIDKSGYF